MVDFSVIYRLRVGLCAPAATDVGNGQDSENFHALKFENDKEKELPDVTTFSSRNFEIHLVS